MKTILSIGDIHGNSSWRTHFVGAQDQLVIEDTVDKVIFVGDYVDSFTISNAEILHNLKEIVDLKDRYPEKVVLLFGNHDIQYITNERYSGYRPTMRPDLRQFFTEHADKFQLAYLHISDDGNKTLWTHAGVTKPWYDELIDRVTRPKFRHREIYKDILDRDHEIDEVLNLALKLLTDNILYVDRESGGTEAWAGPMWVRPKTLKAWAIDGYDQVVGHTTFMTVTEHTSNNFDLIYFIDTQEFGDKSVLFKQY
jgi:predicted phosphodiesterase